MRTGYGLSLRGTVLSISLSALIVFSTSGAVRAEGPVPPGSLPGGVVVTDNDTGSGERWGRAGGRSFTFTVNAPANFSALSWGAVSGTPPHVAFDGTVTSATGEVLTYDAAGSSLPGGVARWTGSAVLHLISPAPHDETLPTRLTLTVTNGSGAVPLAFVAGEVSPGVNVLTAGPFTANLLFQAFRSGGWHPVLDLYDALPTAVGNPPGTTGPVMTGFSSGFYFASAGATLSLADHHVTTVDKLNMIKDDTGFLRIDAINRLIGLGADVGTFRNDAINRLIGLGVDVGMLKNMVSGIQIPPIPQDIASRQDVRNAKDDLQNILLILFGLSPCPPEAGPLCETATFINHLARQHLQVEVVEVSNPSSAQHRRWLLKTTKHGVPVNADLSKLLAITARDMDTAILEDITGRATVVTLEPGLKDVIIAVVPGVTKPHAYHFEVHLDGAPPAHGTALVGAEKVPTSAAQGGVK